MWVLSVAQWLERLTGDKKIAGSIPIWSSETFSEFALKIVSSKTLLLVCRSRGREKIISFQNEIEENVEKMKNERPTQMKPVHDGNIEYKANLAVNNIDTISKLDKMGEAGKIFLVLKNENYSSNWLKHQRALE